MSLTYDPSAIRYASTQEAYGCTWTLNKIESDGAQVWKNAKGHEALVPKSTATAQVNLGNPCVDVNTYRASGDALSDTGDVKAVWRLLDDSSIHPAVKRNPIAPDQINGKRVTTTDECTAYFPISEEMREQWVNGTWENLDPSNYPVEGQEYIQGSVYRQVDIDVKPAVSVDCDIPFKYALDAIAQQYGIGVVSDVKALERELGAPGNSYDNRINDTIQAKKMGTVIPDNYFFPPTITGSQPPLERELGTPEKPAPDPRRSRTIQSIGVDVSSSPPRTALIVAEKMVNGAIMIHDEMIMDKELTNEEIQELAKSLLNRADAQSSRVSVDRPNKSNGSRPNISNKYKIGDTKLASDGTVVTWNGLKWRNPVTKNGIRKSATELLTHAEPIHESLMERSGLEIHE